MPGALILASVLDVRVIAGDLGGRLLVAPRGRATRPTSDRVREALFSILGASIRGAEVLDLYAGSGALGIEALSRGAERATFVEARKAALEALQQNLDALELSSRAVVIGAPLERAGERLARGGARFDVVLVDPPYDALRDGTAVRALGRLLGTGAVGFRDPDARLVLEHARADPSPELPTLARIDSRTYGDTALSFYGSV